MGAAKQPRNLGITLRKDGSFIRVSGYIDEFADYGMLLAEAPPLKLNLAGIVAANSLGLRKWIRFIELYGTKKLELHECPPTFIDAANMIPDVVSANGNMKRIRSLLVPHRCETCRTSSTLVVNTADMVVFGPSVDMPIILCEKCGTALDCEVDPRDHLFFLTFVGESP